MARTAADGKTYIVYSGSTDIKRISVNADHVTWQSSPFGGNTLFLNSTGNDYGVWMTQDLNDVYVAAILGAAPLVMVSASGTTTALPGRRLPASQSRSRPPPTFR